MKLTEHFTLEELVASETAVRAGIDNTPPLEVFAHLELLARELEKVREILGAPIRITSGYRSRRLNQMIGGAKSSAHVEGLAADIICPDAGTPLEICRKIAKAGIVPLDQLIHEYGHWCHLGLAAPGQTPRNELLTIANSVRGYELGLNQVVA